MRFIMFRLQALETSAVKLGSTWGQPAPAYLDTRGGAPHEGGGERARGLLPVLRRPVRAAQVETIEMKV